MLDFNVRILFEASINRSTINRDLHFSLLRCLVSSRFQNRATVRILSRDRSNYSHAARTQAGSFVSLLLLPLFPSQP